ncbi:MAG: acylphosphatase, partial [archaeon YNP-WB-062]|nr:acylphosphatase [Candidatus Culexarchaeum yellowstonense]
MVKALRIRVVGVVQGVGFRPFIYRLATSLNLKGYVVNLGGSEVEIHIEGEKIEDFIKRMNLEKPPQAKILKVIVENIEPIGFDRFEIRESMRKATVRSMIPPDIAICEHCVEEVLNDNTRFHNYHWNSCAWCGPRFSMMYKIPYDRENTSMHVFK